MFLWCDHSMKPPLVFCIKSINLFFLSFLSFPPSDLKCPITASPGPGDENRCNGIQSACVNMRSQCRSECENAVDR